MASFNINDGFCEALVRGLRSGFLKDEDYHHLARCETIEGMMRLTPTTGHCARLH